MRRPSLTSADQRLVESLLSDFVVGNRRIGSRPDVVTNLEWSEQPEAVGQLGVLRIDLAKPHESHTYLLSSKQAQGVLDITTSGQFNDDESTAVGILALSIAYVSRPSKPHVPFYDQLRQALVDVRTSLKITTAQLARVSNTDLDLMSAVESGAAIPSRKVFYNWLGGLGLVCKPRTALVKSIDFSPRLLRFLQEDPNRLRSLTPDQFERFVAERLDRMGYNVTLTGAANRKDGGIDLIAVPKLATVGSIVIAGQVKHHRERKTEREAVDRLLSWKDSFFGVGLLVTNTAFTKDAVWTAAQERNRYFLRLRDFTDLKRWLEGRFGEEKDWREIPDRIEVAPGVVVEIPKARITTTFDFSEEK
jgi:transcriptional regulator with XRE-family HTH domain